MQINYTFLIIFNQQWFSTQQIVLQVSEILLKCGPKLMEYMHFSIKNYLKKERKKKLWHMYVYIFGNVFNNLPNDFKHHNFMVYMVWRREGGRHDTWKFVFIKIFLHTRQDSSSSSSFLVLFLFWVIVCLWYCRQGLRSETNKTAGDLIYVINETQANTTNVSLYSMLY